jgi:uncharacterized membrane protein YhaH (DUF805 family)
MVRGKTMGKIASRIAKFAFWGAVVCYAIAKYITGEMSSEDLFDVLMGLIFLLVVIPVLVWLALSEPHLTRFRQRLEDGFYKTPAGLVFIVCLVVVALVGMFLIL